MHRLSPPGMGFPPYRCLSLARSLLALILLYWSAVWDPPPSIIGPMSVFWHRVCRLITNCFFTTNTVCLHREGCLPPLPALIHHQRCLAGLRLMCSPPEINPATACLPKSVPTFSPHHAPLIARGKITSQPYHFFNLDGPSAPDKAKNPRYRHNAITALANAACPLVHDVSILPPISLHLADYVLPCRGLSHPILASSGGPNNSSSPTSLPPQPPHTTPIRLRRAPITSWAWASLLLEEYTRCTLERVISRLIPHRTNLMPARPARYAQGPHRPSNMPSCPAPRPPIRDPASSKGSRTWPCRPRSDPPSSCFLRWLSSCAPPLLVSLLGYPGLLPPYPPSKPPLSIYHHICPGPRD